MYNPPLYPCNSGTHGLTIPARSDMIASSGEFLPTEELHQENSINTPSAIHLTYGENRRLVLELDDNRLLSNAGAPTANPIGDVSAAVAAALIDPVDFPSLSDSVVPGDTVAIAVDRELPQVGSVTAAVVATLLEANVAAEKHHDRSRRQP